MQSMKIDCISREQALKELKESAEHHANDSREEALLRRDRDIIRALPSVTPQEPRWIPVRERLPEDYETVIASVDRGYVYPEARYSKEDGWEWAYESGTDYWTEIECDVVAWMPLPKPYEPQESEDNK